MAAAGAKASRLPSIPQLCPKDKIRLPVASSTPSRVLGVTLTLI